MSDNIIEVRFGGERVEFLSITVRGRAYRHSRDYWDGNWLLVTVIIHAGKLAGEVPGMLRAEELAAFYQRLSIIHELLLGAASFQTADQWFSLQIEADPSGIVKMAGTISDGIDGTGNQLTFAIDTDQTLLASTLGQLQEALQIYPVYGRP